VEESGHDLTGDTILAFTCRDWGKTKRHQSHSKQLVSRL